MGLGPPLLSLLKFMYDERMFDSIRSVAEIGSQEYDTKLPEYDTFLTRFLRQAGAEVPELRDPASGRYKAPAHELFRRLGCDYASFDIDGRFGSIPFDLNYDSVSEKYLQWSGLTTNLGTTEHVFNQMSCFKTIHDLTRVGGYMLHALPLHNYVNHGLFSYSPCFFEALSESNSYDLLGAWMTCKPNWHLLPPARPPFPAGRSLILVLMRRTAPGEFVVPLQLSNPMLVHEAKSDRYKTTERRAAGTGRTIHYEGLLKIDLEAFTSSIVGDYLELLPPAGKPSKPPKPLKPEKVATPDKPRNATVAESAKKKEKERKASDDEAVERLSKQIGAFEKRMLTQFKDERRIRYFLDCDAGLSSARFVQQHMPDLQPKADRRLLLEFALDEVKVTGLYLEFGVYAGETINIIAQKHAGPIHGFDSFEGLPGPGGVSLAAGQFDVKGQLPHVPSHVNLHKGWFEDTLPKFLKKNPGPVAFMHIDCDIYSSTKTVFDAVRSRLQPGTVIVFDELLNYPSWQEHEWKAFSELVTDAGLTYSFIGRTDSRQVAVRIDRVAASAPRPKRFWWRRGTT